MPECFAVRKENTVNNSRGGFTCERLARILPETMTHKIDVKDNIIYIKDPSFLSNSFFLFCMTPLID